MEIDAAKRRAAPPSAGTAQGQATVTVVHAQRDSVWQVALTVPQGARVGEVLRQSGFAEAFPAYPIGDPAVGIFGRRCHPDETVSDGDRIEIYRPLDFDPMESRRRRAEHRKAAERQTEFRPRRVRGADRP